MKKKNNNAQIHECIIKIKKLEEEIENYSTILNQKQFEIEGGKKKNDDLIQIFTNKNKELELHKSSFDNLKNTLLNEIKNLKYGEKAFGRNQKNREKVL